MNSHQQEITIYYPSSLDPGAVLINERNYKNSGLQEGGVLGGLQYEFPIDTRFYLGLKARGYYLLSLGTFELASLTPTLRYRF